MKRLRIVYILFVLICGGISATAQTTAAYDSLTARYRLRLNGRDLREIVTTISGASTHFQSPTAKAVWNLCQSLLPTITAGSGISVTGTSPNFTITNTGSGAATGNAITVTSGIVNLGGAMTGDVAITGNRYRDISMRAIDSLSIAFDTITMYSRLGGGFSKFLHHTGGNGGGSDTLFNTFLGVDAGRDFAPASTGYANTGIGSLAGSRLNGGSGAATSNTLIGSGTGESIVTGSFNTVVGTRAASLTSTGMTGLTAMGHHAGLHNTGDNNVLLGRSAGEQLTSGLGVFVGGFAGYVNTTGTENTFIGNAAGRSNILGVQNTFVGHEAGYNTATAAGNGENTFMGYRAGLGNTTGTLNTFIGTQAGQANTTGVSNTYLGRTSGILSTGSDNLFAGLNSGSANTSGARNVYLGRGAGSSGISTGSDNILLGYDVNPASNVSNVMMLGKGIYVTTQNSLASSAVGIGTITPGFKLDVAGKIAATDLRINTAAPAVVNQVWTATNTSGDGSWQTPAAGGSSLWTDAGVFTYLTATGDRAVVGSSTELNTGYKLQVSGNVYGNVYHTQSSKITFGASTERLFEAVGSNNNFLVKAGNLTLSGSENLGTGNTSMLGLTSGSFNTSYGHYALAAATTLTNSTAIGFQSAQAATTGISLTAVGANALKLNTSGKENVAIGTSALESNVLGLSMTGVGYQAGLYAIPSAANGENTFVGYRAGRGVSTQSSGTLNTFVGVDAGLGYTTGSVNGVFGRTSGEALTSGSDNALLGAVTGRLVTSGSGNTFIGRGAGNNTTTGGTNIVIGKDIGTSGAAVSNELRIGSLLYGTTINTHASGLLGVGMVAPTAKVHVMSTGSTSGTKGLLVEKADGGDVLETRDDGKTSFNGDAYNEVVNINGQARADAYDIRDWATTDNWNVGEVHFETGSGSNAPTLTVGDGERRFPVSTTQYMFQAIDYNVSWTTGRTKVFWTVPARYNGWKIYRVTYGVNSIGTGTNTIEAELSGASQGTITLTAATQNITLDVGLVTDDIWTFEVLAISGTPPKGLTIEIQLRFF